MSHPCRSLLVLVLLLGIEGRGHSQDTSLERPKLYEGPAPTKKDMDRRSSLHQFVYGLLCQHEDRLLEALKSFEEAAQLDPEAAGVFKAQVPLLILMDRPRDALNAVRKVLELDPTDHETWFLAARLHKGFGDPKEYRAALEKGLAVPGVVEEQPHLAQQLYLDLGQQLEASEAYADAVAAYISAAKILDHPENLMDHGPFQRESIIAKSAETYEKIGHLHRKLKQPTEAMVAYRTAQKRLPEAATRLNLHLAQLAQEQGLTKDALTYIDAYLRLLPQGTEPYKFKIDLLTKLNRSGEVVRWLEQTTKTDPLNVNLKLLLAQQYMKAKQPAQAEELFQTLADESPSEDVYRGLFRLNADLATENGQVILKSLDQAIRKAVKKPPEPGSQRASEQARAILNVLREDAQFAKQLIDFAYRPEQAERELNFETRFYLAVLADKHAKLNQAEKFFRQALDEPGQTNEAPLYSGLLRILWKSRKHEEIIRVCKQGLAKSQNTNHLLFYNDLARAQARLGLFRAAEASAEKAVQIAPDRDRLFALNLQVRILTQAEKFTQAETQCKKMLEENSGPGDMQEIRYLLSSVYSAWKKQDQSEVQLQEILKIDPANATANNDLGYIWADQNKNLKEAEAMIRKAIELDRQQRKAGIDDKDNAAYIDSLGWVLFRKGDHEAARKELERAVGQPDGDDPVLWDHMGDVYYRLERYLQAQSAWERSIQLYEEEHARPKDDRYRDVRRKLDMVKTQVRAK